MKRAVATACVLAVVLAAACSQSSTSPTPTPTPAPPVSPPTVPGGLAALLTSMLNGLSAYITQARTQLENDLPRNPQNTAYIQAKIAMLQNPALPGDIINGRRWIESLAGSALGTSVPIACVFPLESMRGEADQSVQTIAGAIRLIEEFMGMAFPAGSMRVWYGFVVGNSGGGGAVYTEDRTTYETRTPPTRLPHDAILGHEVAHSYIGNESMTQFLELYAYNVARTGSAEPLAWTFTRSWTPDASSNTGVAALLDVFKLVGLDTMRRGYRAVYPLHPPYGQGLPAAVIQAFVDQAPPALQAQVGQKLSMVGF